MIKAKQKNLRVFEIEIDSKDEFFAYMEKNYILLKEYLLVLRGSVDSEVEEYLRVRAIGFYNASLKPLNKLSSTNIDIEYKNSEESEEVEERGRGDVCFFRTIRSGEEIEENGSVSIFGRVNSGSRIFSKGNISIFGEVDGVVESEGDFMVIQKIGSGHVVFKGEILDNDKIVGGMKKIYLKNEIIIIEDV